MKHSRPSKKIFSLALAASFGALYSHFVQAQENTSAPVQVNTSVQAPETEPAKVVVKAPPPVNGVEKLYYDSGALKSERNFKDGKPDGRAVIYHENGKIMTEVTYKNGKRDGVQRSYYEDGKLQEEMELSGGKLNGTHKEYDAQGKLTSEKVYEAAVLKEKKK